MSAESGADANGGTTGANRAARRSKPESQRRVATPWGAAAVVEQAKVAQRAGAKRFATVLELLETTRGEQLVRIAYTTDGVARRGPVTLRLRDLDSLRAAVAREPRLAEAFDRGGGDA